MYVLHAPYDAEMAADADEATTAAIAALLNRDAEEAAWALGESPRRGGKASESDDDSYEPEEKRRKSGT